jgi:cysteine desulfurase
MDWARKTAADFLGARPDEIVFTSGGTEANNLAIKGIALANPRGRHIVSSPLEHEAVLACLHFLEEFHGFEISLLPVAEDGSIAPSDLKAALRPDTTLVSLMLANNEMGAVYPVAEYAAVCREAGVPLHTDAVQAPGWIPLNVADLGVRALSLSGHKFGAPKGSGLLYLNGRTAAEPVIHGGGQEGGLRSGTQNVAWAVALGVALQVLEPTNSAAAKTRAVTSAFIERVLATHPIAKLTGPQTSAALADGSAARHPAIASFTFEGVNGETLLLELENEGVICSSGSACAAGSTEPSHVLQSLGIDYDVARTAVRFSFNHEATMEESNRAIDALSNALKRLTANG